MFGRGAALAPRDRQQLGSEVTRASAIYFITSLSDLLDKTSAGKRLLLSPPRAGRAGLVSCHAEAGT